MASQFERFKQFARRHPKLVQEVRSNRRTWQEIYEEWTIFGEEHDIWAPYRETGTYSAKEPNRDSSPERKNESLYSLLSLLKKIDIDEAMSYASQINEALTSVRDMIEKNKNDKQSKSHNDAEFQQQPPQGYDPYWQPYQTPPWHS